MTSTQIKLINDTSFKLNVTVNVVLQNLFDLYLDGQFDGFLELMSIEEIDKILFNCEES